MKLLTSRLVWAAAALTLATAAHAQTAHIMGPAKGVAEIDFYSAETGGRYVKSVEAGSLSFPIAVVEERPLGFVIRHEGQRYYVGASDVTTDRIYESTALSACESKLAGATGASRGIAGKGCNR